MRTIFFCSLVAAQLTAIQAVAADSPRNNPDEAKRHFQRSRELYDEGDMAGALKEIERSYAAFPNFKLLYNMEQIQAQQQEYAGALRSFRKFLAEGGNEIPEARRTEVLKEVDRLRTRVGELTIAVNMEGAEIAIDDQPVGKSPLAESKTVNVGKRKVTVTLPNHFPVTKMIDIAGLDNVITRVDLQPIVSSPRAEPIATKATQSPSVTQVDSAPTPAAPFRIPVWAPWAATGVLAAATAGFGISALAASNEQKARLARYGVNAAELQAGAGTVSTRALVTDILGGATILAGVGSLLFTLFRAPDAEPAKSTALQFGLAPNGLFVAGEL